MDIKAQNTALLVFIRDSKLEAETKVFAEHLGFEGNEKVAKVLNQRIIKLCQKTDIPTFIFNGSKQKGESFGARISNAFDSLFEKGFENVIAVGNDCLTISCETLQNAKDKLREKEMVLGPARDGGLYLIGLSKSAFQRNQFTNFNWTTKYLTDDFLNFADQFELGLEVFEEARDIDNAADFKIAIKSFSKFDVLIKTLKNILFTLEKRIFLFKNKSYNLSFLRCTALRGPPVLR